MCWGILAERPQISIDHMCPLNVYFIISLWEIGNNLECKCMFQADPIDETSCFIQQASDWLFAL